MAQWAKDSKASSTQEQYGKREDHLVIPPIPSNDNYSTDPDVRSAAYQHLHALAAFYRRVSRWPFEIARLVGVPPVHLLAEYALRSRV